LNGRHLQKAQKLPLEFSASFLPNFSRFCAFMPTKNREFPVIIKAGSSAVKIYPNRKASKDYFVVYYYLGGSRQRLTFSTFEDALTEARAKAAQLSRGDVDAAQLTGQDRLAYGRALEAIRAFKMPLDAAAIEYAEARKILGEHSVVEAARFFVRHCSQGLTGKPVADAVAEFEAEKKAEGRSELYLADLSYRLDEFAKAFNVEVRQLTPEDVRDFFNGLKFSARSFNNHRRVFGTFFNFCQSRGWLAKDAELLAAVGKRKEGHSEIEIFTPSELRALLANASPTMATCLAVQAFAGIRSEELLRLTWQDVTRRPGFIEISAGKAKTAQRRLVPVCDALARWMAIAPPHGAEARIWPHSKPFFFEAQKDTATDAGLAWKANGLRHSFISYRVAAEKDVAAVSLEAGNSPTMIFRHYRELATEAEAREWFSVLPAAGDALNIIPLAS
jgi:integrase